MELLPYLAQLGRTRLVLAGVGLLVAVGAGLLYFLADVPYTQFVAGVGLVGVTAGLFNHDLGAGGGPGVGGDGGGCGPGGPGC